MSEKPILQKNNWLIFNDTTYSQLETSDCNDTISGKCYTDKTLDQCIKLCEDNPNCDNGYHIKTKKSNICVPLINSKPNINPVYRLRNQNIYPELKDTVSTTFVNSSKYEFPPAEANIIFYLDNFFIQNVETGTILETSPLSEYKNIDINFTKDGDLTIQALQIPQNLSGSAKYVPLRYGDKLAFNIPNTTLVIKNSEMHTSEFQWESRSSDLNDYVSFTLYPIGKDKKLGDVVYYSDKFIIKTSVSMMGVNENFMAEKLYYDDYETAKGKGKNIEFKFIPKHYGYFCDGENGCKEVEIENMVVDSNGIGMYEGNPVFRNESCWGLCPAKKYNEKKFSFNYTIVFLILLFIIIFLYFSTRS